MIVPGHADATTPGTGRPVSTTPLTTREQLGGCVKSWVTTVSRFWFSLQITQFGGQYSVERLLALEEYTRTTSFYRVLLVLVVSPLPTLTIALCQESIPLQDPARGWAVNYGFWARVGILALALGCGVAIHVQHFFCGVALSWRQTALFCVSVGACYTSGAMLVASFWVFPIPFTINTLATFWVFSFAVSFYAVAGAKVVKQIRSQRQRLRTFNKFSTVQIVMVCVYPAYQILFNVANHTSYELPVLLVLPFLKILLKSVFASTILDREDTIPEEVTFTIDFFDALYLATFMQTVSAKTVFVVMVVDVVQTAVELRELHHRTRGILQRIGSATKTDVSRGGVLPAVRSLCEKLDPIAGCVNMQVRSAVTHKLSKEGEHILQMLERSFLAKRCVSSIDERTYSLVHALSQFESNSPSASGIHVGCYKRSAQVRATTQSQETSDKRPRESAIVSETLNVLFTAECLILAEYLEAVIPLLHATFLLVMAHLPSAQYHTEMDGVTMRNVLEVVRNIFIYAILELASLVALVIITGRSCGIQALYQLAFVLETQAAFVQCKLIVYLLMTLTYRITHFGTLREYAKSLYEYSSC